MVGVVVPSVGDMSTAVYDSNEDGQIAEDAIINRTRSLFIPPDAFLLTAATTVNNIGGQFPSFLLNEAGKYAQTSFKVPSDFLAFLKVYVWFVEASGNDPIVNINADVVTDDEAPTTGAEAKANVTLVSSNYNVLCKEDSTLVLAGVTAGDLVAVKIAFAANAIYVFGIEFEYTGVL